jgi:multiple sugar transport system ATP-binding protein
MPRVCLEQVSKWFTGGTVAVDELSLEIADGEFMILVGSSGCGKTTALRMVAGLERPTSGSIRIGERVVRQRVAMGRALVREPEVFLLDEPLSNLDAKLRVQMRAELKRLHARLGITTIYVTHDQVEAMTLGDRLAVISDGRLQQLGAPQEVYDHPANVFVAGFIGSPPMNLLRGQSTDGSVAAGDFMVDRPGLRDGELIVGIRPEALGPADSAGPSLDFDVAVVEPLGDELIVHGSVAADIAAPPDAGEAALLTRGTARTEVLARLHPRDRPAEGTTIRLGVDPADVHVFDADTGVAIDDR